MHKMIIAGALTLLLTACQTTGTPGQWIQTGCGFLVLADEVAALIASDPTITTVEQALALICQAAVVPPAAATRSDSRRFVVRVHGVTLHLVRRP